MPSYIEKVKISLEKAKAIEEEEATQNLQVENEISELTKEQIDDYLKVFII